MGGAGTQGMRRVYSAPSAFMLAMNSSYAVSVVGAAFAAAGFGAAGAGAAPLAATAATGRGTAFGLATALGGARRNAAGIMAVTSAEMATDTGFSGAGGGVATGAGADGGGAAAAGRFDAANGSMAATADIQVRQPQKDVH